MPLRRLWILAGAIGTLGALVLFDAQPGINWPLWTAITAGGLLAYRRPDARTRNAIVLPLAFAVALTGGAAVTTTPLLLFLVFAIGASLLALAVVLAGTPERARTYGAPEILTAPIRAFAYTLRGTLRTMMTTLESTGSARDNPALRGSLIAVPVVLVFALLFATADPVFARGRDAVLDALGSWSLLPRVIFGIVLTLFVLGAFVASCAMPVMPVMPAAARRAPAGEPWAPRLGLTERRIVLGATAAVSWLFVLFQLSYLFGTAPAVAGSGITFAEYAHRGFGELAVAATGAALLIVAAESGMSERSGTRGSRALALPALVLLTAVVCILVSAFHRITVYENAYGFTTMRVYVQAYLAMTLVILVALAWQVLHAFDARALARHVMTIALATLTVLVYWNGDAWVARANIDRFAQTGKLDTDYLTRGLSPDAIPAVVAALPRLPAADAARITAALAHEYMRRPALRTGSDWYEWNTRRARARAALLALGAAPR